MMNAEFTIVEAWNAMDFANQCLYKLRDGWFPHGYPNILVVNGMEKFYQSFMRTIPPYSSGAATMPKSF